MEDEEWIDPFDLLQQHQQLIEKLILAHNANNELVVKLIQQNQELTNLTVKNSQKITCLEKLIERLA